VPTSTISHFLQAECASCRPTNSVKALYVYLASQHQKSKPFWILLQQEMMRRQWRQLDHKQTICTSLSPDRQPRQYLTTQFLQARCPSCRPTNSVKVICLYCDNMLPWAYQSPQPKWHLNRFGNFCTAHGRESLYFTMGRPFPPSKLPFTQGIWTPI